MKKHKKRKLLVVVDTNIIINGLINQHGYSHQLILQWKAGNFSLVITKQLKEEYQVVLSRRKFSEKYGLSKPEIASIMRRINKESLLMNFQQVLPINVRDKKDEIIIATAMGGNADYLVTGDKDLLILKRSPKLGNLKIVTVKEFLSILNN